MYGFSRNFRGSRRTYASAASAVESDDAVQAVVDHGQVRHGCREGVRERRAQRVDVDVVRVGHAIIVAGR
jgi:hypothetical protein